MRFSKADCSYFVRSSLSAESLRVGEAWAMLGMVAAGLVLVGLLTADRASHESRAATGPHKASSAIELGAR